MLLMFRLHAKQEGGPPEISSLVVPFAWHLYHFIDLESLVLDYCSPKAGNFLDDPCCLVA